LARARWGLRAYTGATLASISTKEAVMAKEVTCPPCGAIIRGDDDSELVANVRLHAQEHQHEMPPGMTDEQFDAHVLDDAREVAST
jgi:hypothetical protein